MKPDAYGGTVMVMTRTFVHKATISKKTMGNLCITVGCSICCMLVTCLSQIRGVGRYLTQGCPTIVLITLT